MIFSFKNRFFSWAAFPAIRFIFLKNDGRPSYLKRIPLLSGPLSPYIHRQWPLTSTKKPHWE